MSHRLGDVARVLRSKNAGAFEITFDIFLHSRASYEAFKRSGILTPELLAKIYKIPASAVRSIHWYDEVNAVKATIPRRLSCGEPGDTDVYACQQYLPLWYVEVPDEVAAAS